MSMAEDTRKRPDFSSDYSSTPARDPASDPLAELARLIGQNDPFSDGAKRSLKPLDGVKSSDRPAPEWLARPASSSDPDYAEESHTSAYVPPASYRAEDNEAAPHQAAAPQDYRAAPTGFADGRGHAESSRYADHAAHDPHTHAPEQDGAVYQAADDAYQADDRYRVALPSGQYEGDGYYADDGHMPPQGEEGAAGVGRRGGIMTIAAVLGLAVIGTAGAFGYRAFTSGSGTSSNPPVIKADPTPAKTVPAPAAASADPSKPFQDRIGALAAPERVVPREEQPVSLPVAPPAQRVTAPQPSAQAAAPLVAPPATSANEPKRVKTIAIRQDGGNIDTGTVSAPPAVVGPAASAKAPATKQQSGSGPMAIAPQSDPAARSKVATRTPAPVAGGAYVVQVSAQRSESEAQSAYQSLQAKYPGVLGGRNASIKRVDLGDKGGVFYRAQVGSFATSEQATTFCNSLKDAGGQCIVQKN
jgi:SPOR domain